MTQNRFWHSNNLETRSGKLSILALCMPRDFSFLDIVKSIVSGNLLHSLNSFHSLLEECMKAYKFLPPNFQVRVIFKGFSEDRDRAMNSRHKTILFHVIWFSCMVHLLLESPLIIIFRANGS